MQKLERGAVGNCCPLIEGGETKPRGNQMVHIWERKPGIDEHKTVHPKLGALWGSTIWCLIIDTLFLDIFFGFYPIPDNLNFLTY